MEFTNFISVKNCMYFKHGTVTLVDVKCVGTIQLSTVRQDDKFDCQTMVEYENMHDVNCHNELNM